jgi:DNA processing protein
VPGNITSPLSAGCNALIKQGAIPLTDPSDVLDIIALGFKAEQAQLILGDTPDEAAIIELLQQGLRDGDDLLAQTNLDPTAFTQALSMLEIKGLIKSLGANRWTIR